MIFLFDYLLFILMIFAKNFFILHKILLLLLLLYFILHKEGFSHIEGHPLRILLTHIDILIVNK